MRGWPRLDSLARSHTRFIQKGPQRAKESTLLRVGLTGGLASGKSFVGECLVSLGCRLLKADDVGHRLLEPGGGAFESVVQRFGNEILAEDGKIARPKLASIVFGHAERLADLNAIIHPLVFKEEERFFGALAQEDADAIGVVEAAILIETGNYLSFDKVVVAWCRPEIQIARSMHRGLSREETLARLASQMSLDEKLAYADYKVDTSGTKEETRQRVAELHEQLEKEKR